MFQRKYRRVRHPGTPLGGPAGPRPGLQGPREHPRPGPPNPAPANHHCPTAMSSAHAPPSSSHPPHLIHRRPDSTSFVPLPLHLPRSLQCSYGCSAVYATPSAISTEQSLISVQRPASSILLLHRRHDLQRRRHAAGQAGTQEHTGTAAGTVATAVRQGKARPHSR